MERFTKRPSRRDFMMLLGGSLSLIPFSTTHAQSPVPSKPYLFPQKPSPSTLASIFSDTDVVTDSDKALLAGQAKGASVAQTPPTIDFLPIDIPAKEFGTEYGTWGHVVLGPDGKYYFGFGNHSSSDGGQDGSLLASYDPKQKLYETWLFSKNLFGPAGEGKWHGRPDINPETGDLYLVGFYRGHVVHYNIYNGSAKDLGAPVPGSGWPEHTWDWQRQRLYGVGDGKGSVLVYDTERKALIHQGQPVDSITGDAFSWDDRARLLDHETGKLYGSDESNNLTSYDPTTNKFTILKSSLSAGLRAWPQQKDKNGDFWIFDSEGGVYTFNPEQDQVKSHGTNWGSGGFYTSFMERSPGGRYLYYSPSDTPSQGLPVVQYDTQTGQVKVLAFLESYYTRTHKYKPTKIYGGALSSDGQTLFLISNGNQVNGPRIPSLFHIHIPESERADDVQ